jgi:hypothetical protein
MAKLLFTRGDIERLVERLETRAGSVMLADMPRLQAAMRSAGRLLKFMLEAGMPVTNCEIEMPNNGA